MITLNFRENYNEEQETGKQGTKIINSLKPASNFYEQNNIQLGNHDMFN